MELTMIMPLALSSLVWALAFKQVIRGVAFGEMFEYVRMNNETNRCEQGSEPIPFAMLFALYSAITFAVPIALWTLLRA